MKKIPKTLKEKRVSFTYGYHDIPDWMLIGSAIVIFLFIMTFIF